MKIIQYDLALDYDIQNFFKKTFKENDRVLQLAGKDNDLLNITEAYLSSGNFWCLINYRKEICGTIAIRRLNNFYEIRRFFILKKYQNCGYGKQLFDVLMNFAIDNNYNLLRIATMNNGCTIHHILSKYGFTNIERYSESSANLFFELELSLQKIYKYKMEYLKQRFQNSIILNPTENVPFTFHSLDTDFLTGLYISNSKRDINNNVIFGGRNEYVEFISYIRKKWGERLGAEDVDLSLLSGLNAHLLIFLCILKPSDKVMILPEICGGHFSTEKILHSIGTTIFHMIPDFPNFCVNAQKTIEVIRSNNIDYIFVDRSEGLYYEDFSWLNECTNCYKIFDASQYISSILCQDYKNPFYMGFDMLITTLHKNYPGPQKALVATYKKDVVWSMYQKNIQTFISNSHPKAIIDSLFPLVDDKKFCHYYHECTSFVPLLEKSLESFNIPVVKRESSPPATQHIWILCENKYKSYEYYLKLEELGILVNYRLLPYNLGFGLRIGISAAVLSGLQLQHIQPLAEIMSEAYHNDITPKLKRKCQKLITEIHSTAKQWDTLG